MDLPDLASIRQGESACASSTPHSNVALTTRQQVIETESYVNELLGNPKEKETCVSIFHSIHCPFADLL